MNIKTCRITDLSHSKKAIINDEDGDSGKTNLSQIPIFLLFTNFKITLVILILLSPHFL